MSDSVTQIPTHVQSLSTARGRVRFWKTRLAATALSTSALLPPRGTHAVGIINYHRLSRRPGLPLSVTPEAFRRQLSGLLDRGYQAVTAARLCELYEAGNWPPRRTFVITFDDAFDAVRTLALPVLKELGVPASVYLATDFVGAAEFPFDPLVYDESHAGLRRQLGGDLPEAVRPLDRAGVNELLTSGLIEIGGHTHRHEDFIGRPEDFRTDMTRSLEWLHTELGLKRPTFSFPYGGNDPDLRAVCRELNVRCALTTEGELVRPESDVMAWGRFGAEEYDTGGTLAARLGGWFSLARAVWRRAAYRERPAAEVAG